MISPVLSFAALAYIGDGQLATDYTAERALKVDARSTLELQVTALEMERDGEPFEGRGGGGGGGSTVEHHVVTIDKVLERDGAAPVRVQRTFEEIGGTFEADFGGETRERDLDSPFAGLVLELSAAGDGEVEVEVTEGSSPSEDGALEGHSLRLALDALLPAGEVEEGASWDLESGALRRALGLDLQKAYFPPPEREEFGGGGERGGGGGRRGFGGPGGGSEDPLAEAEFEGEATLLSTREDYEGVSCAVIGVECKASGELEEREFGGGGGRRDRLPFVSGFALLAPAFETTYEIELEGKLYFDVESRRPLHFEVEGKVSVERDTERTFGDRSITIYMMREGTFSMTVDVSDAE